MSDETTAEHLHQLTVDRANGSTQPVVMGVTFLPEHTTARTGATVTIWPAMRISTYRALRQSPSARWPLPSATHLRVPCGVPEVGHVV